MTTLEIKDTFSALVRKQAFPVSGVAGWPQASLAKVFEYGLQRILNDASAGAETPEEALELAAKRRDNLAGGILRASPVREGDPVRAEALKLVSPKISAHPAFIAWMQANGFKLASKEAQAEVRKQALAAIERNDGDNAWMTQARANVEAAKGLVLELGDLDLDD